MLNIERIITISLRENRMRRTQTEIELAKLNLQTEFFLADRDHEHAERGCFNSHLTVCKQALAANWQSVLICEDDIKILPFTPKQLERINHFITHKNSQFDVLYLGLIIGKMWFSPYPSIVRAKGAGAHAYLLSARGIAKLANYTYDGTPFDKILKHDFTCYSIYPIIAEQYPETIVASDISPQRDSIGGKDEKFWAQNYRKQYWVPWLNLHKTFFSK